MKTKGMKRVRVLIAVAALGFAHASLAQITLPESTSTNSPLTPEQLAQSAAALEASRQALLQTKFQPFLVQSLADASGHPVTLSQMDTAQRTVLATRAADLKAAQNNATANAEIWAAGAGIAPRAILGDGTIISLMDVIGGIPRFYRTQNAASAATISTAPVQLGGTTGLNLSGTNTIIGIWDGGDVRLTHQEFTTNGVRAYDQDGASSLGIGLHPTHVAGTLMAYGAATNAQGMASRATLHAYDWYGDIGEMGLAAATTNLHISNHSYGSQVGWGSLVVGGTAYWAWFGNTTVSQTEDYQFGFYNANSRNVDQTVYDANCYLPVWAAGNERGTAGQAPTGQPIGHYAWNGSAFVPVFNVTRPGDGKAGGFDTLPPEGVAKNILTVGSVGDLAGGYTNSAGVIISTFTSFGPTDDGRIKPDLAANGETLTSTANSTDSAYADLSGTSMAAPSVAGSLGLLTQLHSQLYGTNAAMWSSTLKGLAIHTADEAGDYPGPDYRYGWGLMNTRRAALLIQSNYQSQARAFLKEVILNNGDYIEFPVVATNSQSLKVTICWTDPAGTPPTASVDPTNRMLINDLDLRVSTPTGATNFPWVLDPTNPAAAATTGDNVRDNVEQIVLTNTSDGTYHVRVTHKGTLVGPDSIVAPQRVSLLVSGIVPQPKPLLELTLGVVSSNVAALRWSALVGQRYQVQYKNDLNITNWTNLGGEWSATKTNLAITSTFTNDLRFYRIVEAP